MFKKRIVQIATLPSGAMKRNILPTWFTMINKQLRVGKHGGSILNLTMGNSATKKHS